MCNCSSNSPSPRRTTATASPRTLYAVYTGTGDLVSLPFRNLDAAQTKRNKLCSSEIDPCSLVVDEYIAP